MLDLQKDPDAFLGLMDPDPDPGGPKTHRSGSATLVVRNVKSLDFVPEPTFPRFYKV